MNLMGAYIQTISNFAKILRSMYGKNPSILAISGKLFNSYTYYVGLMMFLLPKYASVWCVRTMHFQFVVICRIWTTFSKVRNMFSNVHKKWHIYNRLASPPPSLLTIGHFTSKIRNILLTLLYVGEMVVMCPHWKSLTDTHTIQRFIQIIGTSR